MLLYKNMKILGSNTKLNMGLVGLITSAVMLTQNPTKAQTSVFLEQQKIDTFEKTTEITPKGTDDKTILLNAPSADVEIKGEKRTAKIVVDLSTNVLYKYDEFGNAQKAYLIASGKKKTPTDVGIRIVSHTEKYPYKSAPETTRRHKEPWLYGPRAIILDKLDPETGKRSQCGEFIHGNNNPKSIGKYASLGCMRMDNEVIKELAAEVKRGDIVIITK